jgi:RNA polymerase sigma-70 factor (ECF subfamily)
MDRPAQDPTPDDGPLADAPPADLDAFWQLAETLRPYLKSVAARLLGKQAAAKVDASDVVQQALLAAVQKFDQFRGKTAADWQAWLVAIVKNQALNMSRFWRQEVRDQAREQPLPQAFDIGPEMHADGSSPSQQAARREMSARVFAAMDRLPDDHRQVILLRNFEELPYSAIAVQMQRSEQAIRQLWVRAIRQLRQQLGDQR